MLKVEHIGIAVKSLEESNKLFAKLFNKQHYKIESVESEKVNTSFFQMGDTKIELLETTDPSGPIGKFLEKKGVYEVYASKGNHIITVATEHNAVLDSCRHLEKLGAQITYLPVDANGLVDVQELKNAITDRTIIVSVMYANNETGVIQPIKEMAAVAHAHGALMMSDATQAAGKVPMDVNRDGIDLLAFSAHKLYGPKGVGALYMRRKNPRANLVAQMDGGGHERGNRSGTLNVPGVVGFGKAVALAKEELNKDGGRISQLHQKLEAMLLSIPKTVIFGNSTPRVPNTCYTAFEGVNGEELIGKLNSDLAISSGSACSSATLEPSHVLKAMGLSDEKAKSAIRISLGRFTTEEEIIFAGEKIKETVNSLRELQPARQR